MHTVDSSSATSDSGLTCLVMLARFHGVAADPNQIKHHYGRTGLTFGSTEILRASKLFGLKARQISADSSRLDRIQFPAIARTKEGHYCIVGGIKTEGSETKVLIQSPLEQ